MPISGNPRAQRVLTPHEIVVAQFGDGPRDYGSSKVPELSKLDAITVVSSYAVTSDRVFVCDFFRSEVKCYTRDGRYLSTIPVEAHGGPVDIAATDSSLFALHDSPIRLADKSVEWSRYQLFVYDVVTGKQTNHVFLHNTKAGVHVGGWGYVGAVILHADDGNLALVDVLKQETYPVFAGGKPVPESAQEESIRGWGGTFKVRVNQSNIVSVFESDVQVSTTATKGSPLAVSASGSRFAMATVERDSTCCVTIYSADGNVTSVARRPLRPFNKPENPASSWNTYRIVGESLFELRVDDAGVRIIEWR